MNRQEALAIIFSAAMRTADGRRLSDFVLLQEQKTLKSQTYSTLFTPRHTLALSPYSPLAPKFQLAPKSRERSHYDVVPEHLRRQTHPYGR